MLAFQAAFANIYSGLLNKYVDQDHRIHNKLYAYHFQGADCEPQEASAIFVMAAPGAVKGAFGSW